MCPPGVHHLLSLLCPKMQSMLEHILHGQAYMCCFVAPACDTRIAVAQGSTAAKSHASARDNVLHVYPAKHFHLPQDFEALTPNLLARTIETVEGGGIVVLLLSTLTSLTQLFSLTMDVHSRLRTESHQDVTGEQELCTQICVICTTHWAQHVFASKVLPLHILKA